MYSNRHQTLAEREGEIKTNFTNRELTSRIDISFNFPSTGGRELKGGGDKERDPPRMHEFVTNYTKIRE